MWHVFWYDLRQLKVLKFNLTPFFVHFKGFVISCAVDNERSATYMALGSFLPLIMLCG